MKNEYDGDGNSDSDGVIMKNNGTKATPDQ